MKILVTGAAGFIGFHVSRRLLEMGYEVVGIDNINDYYSIKLKKDRIAELGINTSDMIDNVLYHGVNDFSFSKVSLEDNVQVKKIFETYQFDYVCHLGAQAGVRYSIDNPHTYIQSNLVGFANILECCRRNNVKHLVYASSSSVYGLNESMPLQEGDNVDHPISLYAATKKSNELIAHSYSHLYQLPTTGLRFFTVYGPWGRPDMAIYLFTKAILNNEPIKVYNHGKMVRDFTYIEDIVDGVIRSLENIPTGNTSWNPSKPDPSSSPAPYRVFNIGNNRPIELIDFIKSIEKHTGKKAIMNFMDLQPGDLLRTEANIEKLSKLGYVPSTNVDEGIRRFIEWYIEYNI